MVVTSPPYWGLRQYAGVDDHGIGNEPTPEEYVEHLVAVFREVRRVLRDDGTLWLNVGDCYASPDKGGPWDEGRTQRGKHGRVSYAQQANRRDLPGLKSLDLVGMPWLLAFALRADGWYLRADCIWAKGVSGQRQLREQVYTAALAHGVSDTTARAISEDCDLHVGGCMTESVNGWRWERHRVKVTDNSDYEQHLAAHIAATGKDRHTAALSLAGEREEIWADCPGCPKCSPNGGLVLCQGNWRPTRAHEYVFLLSKSPLYYCDREGVRERAIAGSGIAGPRNYRGEAGREFAGQVNVAYGFRNLRDVWTLPPHRLQEAHFAAFPPALPGLCIRAGTSEAGVCPTCGAPWARVVERKTSSSRANPGYLLESGRADGGGVRHGRFVDAETCTIGFSPTCTCLKHVPVPATVLDPFAGAGTTGLAALHLGRNAILIDLSAQYCVMAHKRLIRECRQLPLIAEGGIGDVFNR